MLQPRKLSAAPISTHTSEIARSLAERATSRKIHFFAASDFLSPTFEASGRIGVRVATKAEEARALSAANAYLRKLFEGVDIPEGSLAQDVRTCFLLHELVRDGESEEAARDHTAFRSAEHMLGLLTSDELSKLLGIVNGVQARETPWPETFDDASFGALMGAVAASDDEAAAELLARVERSFLEAAFLEAVRRLTAPEPTGETETAESEG